MRKLATVRKIDEVRPIPGADAIECAIVGGWTVVIKKGEFTVGDLAVYCEIDSWVPTEIAPFLTKGKEPREFNGVKGERLKTVRLRGQLSQGLLLPRQVALDKVGEIHEGDEVSDILGIQKWEMQVPAQLAGQVRGNFPTAIPKTDQERVQNLKQEIESAASTGLQFEVTEKLEGSSMTVYRIQGEFGVCSRNLDLKRDENNTFWKVAIDEDIEAQMMAVDPYWDFAIQGELVGPGIQGNIYKLSKPEFYVFDVYNVQSGQYLDPATRRALVERMGLKHVPVLNDAKNLNGASVDRILAWAEGESELNEKQEREGIVFKEVNGGMTFKAISNKYLLGEK